MIPAIGFMVGAYIIVRLVSFLIRRGQPSEYWAVRVLSAVAGVITLFVMAYLFVGPGELTRPTSTGTSTTSTLLNAAGLPALAPTAAPQTGAQSAGRSDAARMKQMLAVTLTDMVVLPEDSRAGRFSSSLTFTLEYKNIGTEDIRAFTGVMTFADLFDRPMKKVSLTHDTALSAGRASSSAGRATRSINS